MFDVVYWAGFADGLEQMSGVWSSADVCHHVSHLPRNTPTMASLESQELLASFPGSHAPEREH